MGEDYITNRNTRELSPGRIARVRVMVERATVEKPAFGTSRGSSQQPCPQAGGAAPRKLPLAGRSAEAAADLCVCPEAWGRTLTLEGV